MLVSLEDNTEICVYDYVIINCNLDIVPLQDFLAYIVRYVGKGDCNERDTDYGGIEIWKDSNTV